MQRGIDVKRLSAFIGAKRVKLANGFFVTLVFVLLLFFLRLNVSANKLELQNVLSIFGMPPKWADLTRSRREEEYGETL